MAFLFSRRVCTSSMFVFICAALICSSVWAGPKNIIFLIGDGMGDGQIEATEAYLGEELSFKSLPHPGWIMTYPADVTVITDSAAAGTALATGRKVFKNVVSVALPGDGSELATMLEKYASEGKSTGLVTTTFMTHATPATFGAHEEDRGNYDEIAIDYFMQEPAINVLFGGGANGLDAAADPENNTNYSDYTIVTDYEGLAGIDTETATLVSGQFGDTYLPYEYDGVDELPHLSEMTTAALAILDNDPDGFFLMVEGGRIDQACHDNDLERAIGETIEFSNTVQVVMDWALGRDDTLIVVGSDHETGGLEVVEDNGPGEYPDVTWSSKEHTDADVPVFAWGVNAELVWGVMDNTYMYTVCTCTGSPTKAGSPYPGDVTINHPLDVDLAWRAGAGVQTQEVYFGTEPEEMVLVSTQSDTFFEPGMLVPNTIYYWRVDGFDGEGTLIAEGDVWSFATIPGVVYVEDISMGYRMKGSWYVAQATVTVETDTGESAYGAVVKGDWYFNGSGNGTSGDLMTSVEGTVGRNGKVTLESLKVKTGGLFTFEVMDIEKDGLSYICDFNVETSDSIIIP